MTAEEQAFFLGRAWEAIPEPKIQFVLQVVRPDGTVSTFRIGPHTPSMKNEDVLQVHRLWLNLTRETGLADALITLHKSPGQHGPDIRMNWFYMKAWRWFADAAVYLTLFISVSGIYLWYMLRAERRVGLILLAAGTLTFFGLAYVISH